MSGFDVSTPGHIWGEMDPDLLLEESPPQIDRLDTVDLFERYPLPDKETLQETWDRRQERTADAKASELSIPYTVFNSRAEAAGTVLWLPGWGVSSSTAGGARSATLVAAMNPNLRVIVPEEAEGVSAKAKFQAWRGDFKDYSRVYLIAVKHDGQSPNVVAGHSRGGVIAMHLAEQLPVRVLNIQDTPVDLGYHNGLVFAAKVGGLDNKEGSNQTRGVGSEEESTIESLPIAEELTDRGIKEMAGLYAKQLWLVHGLGRASLIDVAKSVIGKESAPNVVWTHGRNNIGIPVERIREAVDEISRSVQDELMLRYFEANTGHYAIGHAARFGRIIRMAVDLSKPN